MTCTIVSAHLDLLLLLIFITIWFFISIVILMVFVWNLLILCILSGVLIIFCAFSNKIKKSFHCTYTRSLFSVTDALSYILSISNYILSDWALLRRMSSSKVTNNKLSVWSSLKTFVTIHIQLLTVWTSWYASQ